MIVDEYHGYITHRALRLSHNAMPLVRSVISRLKRTSGASNVSNGRITVREDARLCIVSYSVSFDSAAWTGRHA